MDWHYLVLEIQYHNTKGLMEQAMEYMSEIARLGVTLCIVQLHSRSLGISTPLHAYGLILVSPSECYSFNPAYLEALTRTSESQEILQFFYLHLKNPALSRNPQHHHRAYFV
jgi:hypothetical protein